MGKWAMSVLIWILLFVGFQPVVADVDRGLAAFRSGAYEAALVDLLRAAELGHVTAQFVLGLMYQYGTGVSKSEAEAVRWYREAGKQGDSRAQINLAHMYSRGEGVPKNDEEAVYWFRQAAEQGVNGAQFSLALRYFHGEGVPKNDEEAVYWYRRAANQGHSFAQMNLGHMYDHGMGVPQNHSEALRWYRRAAQQGNIEAQFNLGAMYALGQGVPKNDVFAYQWVSLAAAQGDEQARENLRNLERRMTREQIAEAQRLAAAFQARAETHAVGTGTVGTPTQPRPQSERPPPVGSTTVRQIQSHLKALGYDPGPVDGLMGKRTVAAIRSFQHDAGIEPDGLASTTLAALLAAVLEDHESVPRGDAGDPGPRLASTGTGFFVTEEGHLLTNHHVVQGCALVRVGVSSGSVDGTTVASNAADDLAVVHVANAPPRTVAAFRGTPATLGEDVIVIGYPLRSVLGSAVNVTFGSVSSTSGPAGDRRYLQITAPVQQGNSGGPLLDESGAVVGVVVAKLDALSVAIATGDIPQNINFGIKGAVARSFLSIHDIGYQAAPAESAPAGRPAVVGRATEFTVPVECWK